MRHLLAILLMTVWVQAGIAQNLLREETPHQLYIDDLGKCSDCSSFTIIISDERVQPSIARTFKSIAESFGRKHAGAMVSWGEALKQYRFFKHHACGSFTDLARQVVVYIDTRSQFCGRFPFTDERQLMAMISIVSANLDDAPAIKNEVWRLKTKQAVASYAASNKIAGSVRHLVFDFVDYVGEMLLSAPGK